MMQDQVAIQNAHNSDLVDMPDKLYPTDGLEMPQGETAQLRQDDDDMKQVRIYCSGFSIL
jgi:hypothetical protein